MTSFMNGPIDDLFSLIGTAEDRQTEQPLLNQSPSQVQDSKETEEIETSKKRQSFINLGFLRAGVDFIN